MICSDLPDFNEIKYLAETCKCVKIFSLRVRAKIDLQILSDDAPAWQGEKRFTYNIRKLPLKSKKIHGVTCKMLI